MRVSLPLVVTLAICAAVGCIMSPAAFSQVNQQAIDDVAAGKLTEAKASWWGFDETEATAALQAAIDSGVPRLIVDNVGKPWIVDRMTLVSNQQIVFEEGVEVVAKKGAFKGKGDTLFTASLKQNIILYGYGATWRMHRADYDGPEYEKAEWRHCLSIRSCTNVRVLGLTLAESGGDGIYLGTGQAGVTNKDIVIQDVLCDRNYRQGISVITAENLLIENTIMRDTGGTAPQAGIDFEPNLTNERLVNCVMRDCTTQGNVGVGYAIYIPTLDASSEDVSLRFENCRSIGDSSGTFLATGNTEQAAVGGSIEYVNCRFESPANSAIQVRGKPVGGLKLSFEGCAAIDPAPEKSAIAPIQFSVGGEADRPFGGISLGELTVKDDIDRVPMAFNDMAGGIGWRDITGKLLLERGGQVSQLDLTVERLKEWMPFNEMRFIPRFKMEDVAFVPVAEGAVQACDLKMARTRRSSPFVLYAEQGQEVGFTLNYGQVGKYSGNTSTLRVLAPSGAEAAKVDCPFMQETQVGFTAPETGLYRIDFNPGGNNVSIGECTHPVNVTAEKGAIPFFFALGRLYLYVPEGATEFGVKVFGQGPGEAIKVGLHNPEGELVQEQDNIVQAYLFDVTLDEPSRGETWMLEFSRPTGTTMEDFSVDILGIPPLLAPSPEALLKPAG